jgi:aspartyl-tRNA(Asn)/glutamyl-tRNA(Gln) amidotransferase subunit B
MTYGDYEPVIGLEVHAQLLTRTKLFCSCQTSFGDPPNTHTCPVCLGLPGSLPVLNAEALRMAVTAALTFGCTVAGRSVFARKNYFYPDLPKGYQISQYELPLAAHGHLDIELEPGASGRDERALRPRPPAEAAKRHARILRIHMEEDAGKSVHGVGASSIVDLNRAGTALVEIVGEPDLRSPAEAVEYLKRLREALIYAGVNDGNLEQGSFRCDANVSVRKRGTKELGTRTELKNINSFKFVSDAIEHEIHRQIALLERGERVRQQTRGYSADKRETYLLRDKENEAGYRYFPEPDLPPLVVDPAFIEAARRLLPESPSDKRARFIAVFGLTPYAAGVLTAHPRIAAFFEETVQLSGNFAAAANFIQAEVLRDVRTTGLDAIFPVTPKQVAELIGLVEQKTISGKQAKEVYAAMAGTSKPPSEIVRERNMTVLHDEGAIVAIARALLAANPKQVAAYRSGKSAILGFFVGQLMKETRGSASPEVVNTVLVRLLSADDPLPSTEPAMAVPATMHERSLAPTPQVTTSPLARSLPAGPPSSTIAPLPPTIAAPFVRPLWAGPEPKAVPPPAAPSPPAATPASTTPSSPDRARITLTSANVASLGADPKRTTLTPISSAPMTTLSGGPPAAASPAPVPATVSFDHFAALDLRVGLIVEAARVPKRDQLLDLRVDVGDPSGPRRVVAGLALSFAPEALVGQRVLVVCNLEPRAFSKDLISRGMILATGPSETLALATVSKEVAPGTRVK